MRIGRWFTASLLANAASTTAREPDECTLSDYSGSYDLRGLQRKEDWSVRNYDNDEVYFMNFCGPITRATWAVSSPSKIGGYYEGPHGGISLGRYNTTLSRTSGALAFTYTSGSTCPNTSNQRGMIVHLQCDTSWGSSSGPVLVGIIDECFYSFSFKTPHACPISLVSSIGSIIWVFVSFVVMAAAVSLGSAIAYNRFVLHKRGSEQFPSMDKIKDALEFVKDMGGIAAIYLFDFLKTLLTPVWTFLRRQPSNNLYSNVDYTRGAWSRSAQSSFQPLPTEPPPPPQKDTKVVNVGVDILGDDESDEEEDGEGPGKTHKPFKDDVEVV